MNRGHGEELDREDRRLCSECIGEAFLRAKVEKMGAARVCSYCARQGRTFSIDEIADAVEIAFEEHFYRTAAEPSGMEDAMMREGDYDWEREGEPVVDVIGQYVQVDSEPAEDIRNTLEDRRLGCDQIGDEGPFDLEAHYAEGDVDDADSQAGWFHFEQKLKSEARYFSRTAEQMLRSIFEGIAEHETEKGRPIIVEAGPGMEVSSLYRARVFQSSARLLEALKRPDKEVGPPPPLAATSGRMNAQGIVVFYGATDPLVALAEVRPPVGSTVVVGRFELIRPVRLLDVEALRSVNVTGSIFDRDFIHRLARAKFLKWLSRRIAMPVMPDDEPFDYLATQAIADFLATEANPALDGLLYPSVQGSEGKLNVVLFHKAARVQPLAIPKGTVVSAHLSHDTEDGPGMDYCVFERVAAEAPSPPAELDDFPFSEPLEEPRTEDFDAREPTLRLDIHSLTVHHISSITFKTQPYSVHRYRSQKREPTV